MTGSFHLAAELSIKVNFEIVEDAYSKGCGHLDPQEFHSTWLWQQGCLSHPHGLADGADLIILAPGVKNLGEDKTIDELIRKYGVAYSG